MRRAIPDPRTPPCSRLVRRSVAMLLAAAAWTLPATAAPGDLDTTFHSDGMYRFWLDAGGVDVDHVEAVALQKDGKIVVAGWVTTDTNIDGFVARLHPGGGLDTSFSGDGVAVLPFDLGGSHNDFLSAVAVQDDGKIVVAGTSDTSSYGTDITVYRMLANGLFDPLFGVGGFVQVRNSVVDDPDQTDDETLGSMLLYPGGKIVLAGRTYDPLTPRTDFFLARLYTNGDLDPNFDGDGTASALLGFDDRDVVSGVAKMPWDDSLMLAAVTNTGTPSVPNFDCALARFTSSGALDTTFDGDPGVNGNGKFVLETDFTGTDKYDSCRSIGVTPGPPPYKIYVGGSVSVDAGSNRDFLILRLTGSGARDTSFDSDGRFLVDFDLGSSGRESDRLSTLLVVSTEQVVVGGTVEVGSSGFHFGIARIDVPANGANPTLDSAFGTSGRVHHGFSFSTPEDDDSLAAMALLPDQRVLAVGGSRVGSGVDVDVTLLRVLGDLPPGWIFGDGFESGNTWKWTMTAL